MKDSNERARKKVIPLDFKLGGRLFLFWLIIKIELLVIVGYLFFVSDHLFPRTFNCRPLQGIFLAALLFLILSICYNMIFRPDLQKNSLLADAVKKISYILSVSNTIRMVTGDMRDFIYPLVVASREDPEKGPCKTKKDMEAYFEKYKCYPIKGKDGKEKTLLPQDFDVMKDVSETDFQVYHELMEAFESIIPFHKDMTILYGVKKGQEKSDRDETETMVTWLEAHGVKCRKLPKRPTHHFMYTDRGFYRLETSHPSEFTTEFEEARYDAIIVHNHRLGRLLCAYQFKQLLFNKWWRERKIRGK